MFKNNFIKKIVKVYLLLLVLVPLLVSTNLIADSISTTNKYAWSENAGWLNFSATYEQVKVYDDHLEGYAWSESVGWIRMGTVTTGATHTYANDAANTYGVNNDGNGNLSGYAWSENAGWINFNSNNSQVTINATTGDFNGYAWAESIGWIHFQNSSPAYKITRVLISPTVFSFIDQTSVQRNTLITSNSISVSGINTSVTISVTGGEYEINGNNSWLTVDSTVVVNDTVKVRHTSSTTYSTTTDTTLSIGTQSDTFSTTTLAAPTPTTVPDPPIIGTAIASNAQATLSFTVPSNNGGSTIIGYTVTSSPAGGVDSNAGSTTLNHNITGLSNGTAYTFTVTATNASGTGTASAASNSVTPSTVPDAPTIGTGTAINSAAIVTFSAPSFNGGSAIIDYTASCGAGVDATGKTSPLIVTGLSNATSYPCSVTARNAQGSSSASGTVSITPTDTGSILLLSATGSVDEPATFTYSATPLGSATSLPVSLTVVTPTASTPDALPAGVESLVSAIDIRSTSSVSGYTLTVIFSLDPGSSNEIYGFWKYGKEAPADTDHWYDYETLASHTEGTLDGTGYVLSADKKTITVHFIDGIRGDVDLTANKAIIDPALLLVRAAAPPAAAAAAAEAIPTLSSWALILLVGMLALFGSGVRVWGKKD